MSLAVNTHLRQASSSGRLPIPVPWDVEKKLQALPKIEMAPKKHAWLQPSGDWKEVTFADKHGKLDDTLKLLKARIDVLTKKEAPAEVFDDYARCWKQVPNTTNVIDPVNDYVTSLLRPKAIEISTDLQYLNLIERRSLGDPTASVESGAQMGSVQRVCERYFRSIIYLVQRIWVQFCVINYYTAQFREIWQSLETLYRRCVARINEYYASQLVILLAEKVNSSVVTRTLVEDVLDKVFFEEQIPCESTIEEHLKGTQLVQLQQKIGEAHSTLPLKRHFVLFTRDLVRCNRFYIHSLGYASTEIQKTTVDVVPLIMRSNNAAIPDPAPKFVFMPLGGDFTAPTRSFDYYEFQAALKTFLAPVPDQEIQNEQQTLQQLIEQRRA